VELLTLSEWCRETLLANVNGQEEKTTHAGGTSQALMALAERSGQSCSTCSASKRTRKP
jgi:hypothetical protein